MLLRLKKADSQSATRNYPTPLAGLFHRHEKDLFGHEGHQRVELVHVFNPLQTELIWIGVVARDERRNVLWSTNCALAALQLFRYRSPRARRQPQRPFCAPPSRAPRNVNKKKNSAVRELQSRPDRFSRGSIGERV